MKLKISGEIWSSGEIWFFALVNNLQHVLQIKLDLNDGEKSAELEDSNVLALPSKKRQSKVKLDGGQKTVKRLTRKERKRLQKIVEQKEKKSKVT